MHVPTLPDPTVPTSQAGVLRRKPFAFDTYVNVPPMSHQQRTYVLIWHAWKTRGLQVLLRKEVIQPHLPVRLPCYDLVLITDPTFDGSLHKG